MIPILFYNWNLLKDEELAKIDSTLKLMTTNSIINGRHTGNSFILKPDKLWLQSSNIFELYEVYQIASSRNYFYYFLYGYKGAYMDFCGISLQSLKSNRLLILDEKNRLIHFKHEI